MGVGRGAGAISLICDPSYFVHYFHKLHFFSLHLVWKVMHKVVLGESHDQSECYPFHPPWSGVVFAWALPLLIFHFPTCKKSSWAWPEVPGCLGSPAPDAALA